MYFSVLFLLFTGIRFLSDIFNRFTYQILLTEFLYRENVYFSVIFLYCFNSFFFFFSFYSFY